MKAKRYTTEQKIRILREAEKADRSIVELCREKGISEQTFHRWNREFGMMKLDQAKQLMVVPRANLHAGNFAQTLLKMLVLSSTGLNHFPLIGKVPIDWEDFT